MKNLTMALLCAVLSAAALALAARVEVLWWLGWIAPAPLLWFAFGAVHPLKAGAAALLAGGLAALAVLSPWLAVLTEPVIAAGVALGAVGFGLCVMPARFAAKALAPAAGPVLFGALWAVWDYVAAQGPDGALASPAWSQAPVPLLIQTASLGGGWLVTFLMGAVAGFVALGFRRRHALYLLPAAGIFLANLLYGVAAVAARAPGPERTVALIDNDGLAEAADLDNRDIALGAVLAYAAEIRLKARDADFVVLPERIAVLRPAWRAAALDALRVAARATGATIVAGFAEPGRGGLHNVALLIAPGGVVAPYRQGGPLPGGGLGIAISHDLNHGDMLRTEAAGRGLLAVPAWDFGGDARLEAHKAVFRAVENDFAVARTARNGILLLADASGRTLAAKPSEIDGFTTLIGKVPLGTAPGLTAYDRYGDAAVTGLAGLAALLLVAGLLRLVLRALKVEPGDLRRRLSATLSRAERPLHPQ